MENILNVPLPTIHRDKYLHQQVLLAVSHRKMYTFNDVTFKLSLGKVVTNPVRIEASFRGHPFDIIVSKAMVNAALQPFHTQIDDLSEDAKALFLLAKKGFCEIQMIRWSVLDTDYHGMHVLCAKDVETNEEFGWEIAIDSPQSFPLHALANSLETYVSGELSFPLANLPIPVPLMVTSLQMSLDELDDLQLGDVLLLG